MTKFDYPGYTVCFYLEDILKDRNMTLYEFSKLSRIDKSALRRYINGKNFPHFLILMDICNYLEIELYDLINYSYKDNHKHPPIYNQYFDLEVLI